MRLPLVRPAAAIVAIPAHDEEDRIGACLAALAVQRDGAGVPLAAGSFDVLILANNCSDDTAAVARGFADRVPYRLHVVECRLPPAEAHAGGARRAAMDHAARLLSSNPGRDATLLTTDADSRAQPTWMAENLKALAAGVDAVAGYIAADAEEVTALGSGFLGRGRLEDRFLSRVAELYAVLDPRRHDPWPNHRVHSGASFAVTLSAYRAIGGLPSQPLGEDSALAMALENSGFLIRHALEPVVVTSCRFDSRAPGGAGDTMRQRHENLDAECDGDLEPVERLFGRARLRGMLRHLHGRGRLVESLALSRLTGLCRERLEPVLRDGADLPFARLWSVIETESPLLRRGQALRPSDLPREIAKAERLLGRLRTLRARDRAGPADTQAPAAALWVEAAAPQRR